MKVRTATIIACGILLSAMTCRGEVKVDEKVLGPKLEAAGMYQPNPFGTHFAEVAPKGSRAAVIYDGTEGPPFDEIVQVPLGSGVRVTYSADGNRWAYVGRQGEENVIMVDGKELVRGAAVAGKFDRLYFSPGGKSLCYEFMEPITSSGGGRYKAGVDGKSWLLASSSSAQGYASWLVTNPRITFSRDDLHFAVATMKSDTKDPRDNLTLLVNGKDAGYVGEGPQFTLKNEVLSFASTLMPAQQTLLLDGKAIRKSEANAPYLRPIFDPTGHHYALISTNTLFIDNKTMTNAEGIDASTFVWSADGKHYAYRCLNANLRPFMVIDGKKERDYEAIGSFEFSHDSSKAIYCAKSGPKWYLVINGEESKGNSTGIMVVQNKQGTRLAYVLGSGTSQSLELDGKSIPARGVHALEFSPDGGHYAYVTSDMTLVVDGTEQAGIKITAMAYKEPVLTASGWTLSGNPRQFVFSPDGKHIAHVGMQKKRQGLFVDGVFVSGSSGEIGRVYFTPDSQHLVWTERVKALHHIYVDGHDVAQLEKSVASVTFDVTAGNWAMGDDGVFNITGLSGDSVKRLRVTPSADMSVASMLAAAQRDFGKSEADATSKKPATGTIKQPKPK